MRHLKAPVSPLSRIPQRCIRFQWRDEAVLCNWYFCLRLSKKSHASAIVDQALIQLGATPARTYGQAAGGSHLHVDASPQVTRRGEMIEFLAHMPTDTKIFLTMAVLGLAAMMIVLRRLI